MKKIILSLVIVLFLVSNLMAFDLFDYVGKKVIISTFYGNIYVGTITNIIEVGTCKRTDGIGNCIEGEKYCTLFLQTKDETIPLNCGVIANIVEIK
jgi:hypothetical protein